MKMLTTEQVALGKRLVGTLTMHGNHAREAEKINDPSIHLPHRAVDKLFVGFHAEDMRQREKEAIEIAHALEASEIVRRAENSRPFSGAIGAVRRLMAKKRALADVRRNYSTPEQREALVKKWAEKLNQHQLSRIV